LQAISRPGRQAWKASLGTVFRIRACTGDDGGMFLGFEVTFADGHVFFPAGHLSRIGGTFDGTLAASAIRDADPAAAPPEIRTLSGETLFVSGVQREELERFCRASRIPVRKRPDVWGDLLEPFVDTEFTPEREAVTRNRLRQARLTDTEIGQIRAKVGPLMLAYNAFYWDWAYLGLADLLDAVTTDSLPEDLSARLHVGEIRAELGETASFYAWAIRIANSAGPQPAV
jgi:hypothetical protein